MTQRARVSERQHIVSCWRFQDVLLETYHYAPGPAGGTPKHCHEEYQFCLSLNFPGEYVYRRARHPVPVGSLSVIHPGEVHSTRDPIPRRGNWFRRSEPLDPSFQAPDRRHSSHIPFS
ncbi:MAG: AraC family ligand binding domain-containing protein [Chromatiales bacterium]